MATSEEFKAMIRARLSERKGEMIPAEGEVTQEVGEEGPPFVEEDGDFDEVEDAEFEEVFEEFEEQESAEVEQTLRAFYDEGVTAYYGGMALEDMPYITEEEDEENIEIIIEAWNSGWLDAHRETWVATILLTSKDLIEATDSDEMTKAISTLKEAIGVLEDGIIDFDELREEYKFS